MCLACLKWGLLVWQLTPRSMETWALDTSKQVQWKFLVDVAGHEAAEAIPAFDRERGIEVNLGSWEPLVKTTLRLHSSKLTVQDFCALATIGFNIPEKEAKACTKVQLVRALALKVADEDFADMVCQSLSQAKKSEDDDDTGDPECDDELGKMLLEMLEPSDLSEFMDLKKEAKTARRKAKFNRAKAKAKAKVKGRAKAKAKSRVQRRLSFGPKAEQKPQADVESAQDQVVPQAENAPEQVQPAEPDRHGPDEFQSGNAAEPVEPPLVELPPDLPAAERPRKFVVPDEPRPASSSAAASGSDRKPIVERRPNQHHTPISLQSLTPPGCTLCHSLTFKEGAMVLGRRVHHQAPPVQCWYPLLTLMAYWASHMTAARGRAAVRKPKLSILKKKRCAVEPIPVQAQTTAVQPEIPVNTGIIWVPKYHPPSVEDRILEKNFHQMCHRTLFDFLPTFRPAEFEIVLKFERMISDFLRVDASVNGGRAAAVWPRILHLCYPVLAAMDLTRCLLAILMRGHRNQASGGQYDFAEVFAGRANMSREFLRAGFAGSSFDVRFSDSQDILSCEGMRLILDAVTALKKEGEASSMLFFVAYALQIFVTIENPTSSVIDKCPSLSGVFAYVKPWCFTTYMGAYCGRSVKPLKLWSTCHRLQALECDRPSNTGDDELVRRHGGQFTGNKTLLQESEVYTPAFGKAVEPPPRRVRIQSKPSVAYEEAENTDAMELEHSAETVQDYGKTIPEHQHQVGQELCADNATAQQGNWGSNGPVSHSFAPGNIRSDGIGTSANFTDGFASSSACNMGFPDTGNAHYPQASVGSMPADGFHRTQGNASAMESLGSLPARGGEGRDCTEMECLPAPTPGFRETRSSHEPSHQVGQEPSPENATAQQGNWGSNGPVSHSFAPGNIRSDGIGISANFTDGSASSVGTSATFTDGFASSVGTSATFKDGFASSVGTSATFKDGFASSVGTSATFKDGFASSVGTSATFKDGFTSSVGNSATFKDGFSSSVGTSANFLDGFASSVGTSATFKDGFASSVGTSANFLDGFSSSVGTSATFKDGFASSDGTNATFTDGFASSVGTSATFKDGFASSVGTSATFKDGFASSVGTMQPSKMGSLRVLGPVQT
eukprot:s308_g30.t1